MKCEVIDMRICFVICCICGTECQNKWGVPIDAETALICDNDYAGKWGAKPACKQCHKKHSDGKFIGHDPEF